VQHVDGLHPVDEASDFKFEDITVRGKEATIGFPDGRRWRLVSSGRRWLIAELPFLPPSVEGSAESTAPA
jgi:hypothetical protein